MEIGLEEFPELVTALKSEYDYVDMRRTGRYHGNGTELISVAVSLGHGEESRQAAYLFSALDLGSPELVMEIFRRHFKDRGVLSTRR